ncbi:MAG: cytochrome c biogenesis protein CcsA [bacterium]
MLIKPYFEDPVTKNVTSFSQIPLVFEGRLQPFDSLARNTCIFLSGKQRPMGANSRDVILELISMNPNVDDYPLFLIRDTHVLDFLSLSRSRSHRYSFSQLVKALPQLWRQASSAEQIEAKKRHHFHKNIILLRNQVDRYLSLKHSFFHPQYDAEIKHFSDFSSISQRSMSLLDKIHRDDDLSSEELTLLQKYGRYLEAFQFIKQQSIIFPIPSTQTNSPPWIKVGDALLLTQPSMHTRSYLTKLYHFLETYTQASTPEVTQLAQMAYQSLSFWDLVKVKAEFYFNQSQLFLLCLCLYLLLFIIGLILFVYSLPSIQPFLRYCLYGTFTLHSLGILLRMFIQGRPPVTNLYSSVIFVAFISILLFLILEKIFKHPFLFALSNILGFSSLILAQQLSLSGDTLEQMRAVLDSNFWLATHVVTMCIGYGAMFVSGFISSVAIMFGFFSKKLRKPLLTQIYQMTYGILCAALLFSVVGTLLGGIWGDQSWGRFWGWDPKENGAFLIVLWCGIILHSRLAGLIKHKGFFALCALGNIVTAFSWFGVNMLGVGLHSYGFMKGGFVWLLGFSFVQFYIACLGMLPDKFWKSFRT